MEALTSSAIWAIETMIKMGPRRDLVWGTGNSVANWDDDDIQSDRLSIQQFMDIE